MKTINININLYKYEELNEEAKEKAFDEHLSFLCSIPYEYETEDEDGNIIQKTENILKWNYEELKFYVEDSININEYLFFESGEMANITHYTGKHIKSGKTELKFLNKVYEV